jgi:hypothetical protein
LFINGTSWLLTNALTGYTNFNGIWNLWFTNSAGDIYLTNAAKTTTNYLYRLESAGGWEIDPQTNDSSTANTFFFASAVPDVWPGVGTWTPSQGFIVPPNYTISNGVPVWTPDVTNWNNYITPPYSRVQLVLKNFWSFTYTTNFQLLTNYNFTFSTNAPSQRTF